MIERLRVELADSRSHAFVIEMKMKRRTRRPTRSDRPIACKLELDKAFQPCHAELGDELYPNGIFEFNMERRLAEHFQLCERLDRERPSDVPLMTILDRYYHEHASKLPSKAAAQYAMHGCASTAAE